MAYSCRTPILGWDPELGDDLTVAKLSSASGAQQLELMGEFTGKISMITTKGLSAEQVAEITESVNQEFPAEHAQVSLINVEANARHSDALPEAFEAVTGRRPDRLDCFRNARGSAPGGASGGGRGSQGSGPADLGGLSFQADGRRSRPGLAPSRGQEDRTPSECSTTSITMGRTCAI